MIFLHSTLYELNGDHRNGYFIPCLNELNDLGQTSKISVLFHVFQCSIDTLQLRNADSRVKCFFFTIQYEIKL